MNLLFLLAIFPGLAICYYIWWRDKYEREPHKYLVACFLFGIFGTIPAIFLETFGMKMGIVSGPDIFITFMFAMFVVGLSEELCKFVFLRYYIYPKKEFCEPMDGIVYSVMISMGFATLENILYVFQGGINVALLRMFLSVPAHAAFAVIMGYFVGMAKFESNPGQKFMFLNTGLGAAVLAHGLYDFFIMQENYPFLAFFTLGTFVIAVVISFRMIKTHVENSPHKEKIRKDLIEHLYSGPEEQDNREDLD